MKKLTLIILFNFFLITVFSQTKEIEAAQVPKVVTDNFTKENPAITPAWKVDGKNYKAFYTDPKTNMSQLIVYDDKGNVQRKESELDNLNYPSPISDYHSKNYPQEKYKVWSVQDETGKNNYYSDRNSKVLWFDKNGNYVSPEAK